MRLTTVGIDLTKSIFQVHAVIAAWYVVLRKALAGAGRVVLRQASALPSRHGGVRSSPSFGPGARSGRSLSR